MNRLVRSHHIVYMKRYTSVVSVENSTLLVPLSNMIVRSAFRSAVVFPLTDSCGDASCHVLPALMGRDANVGLPTVNHILHSGFGQGHECRPLTLEFRAINTPNR